MNMAEFERGQEYWFIILGAIWKCSTFEPRRAIADDMKNNDSIKINREKKAYSLGCDLDSLAAMTLPDLRKKWRDLYGSPIPKVSAALLRLAIAFEIQKAGFGDLSRETTRRLDYLARGKAISLPLRPGMRLVREWKGHLHVVVVDADCSLIWQKRSWRSLSEIARAITGTQWSGPAFFGLTEKAAAA